MARFTSQCPFPGSIVESVVYAGKNVRADVALSFPLNKGFNGLDNLSLSMTTVICAILKTSLIRVLREDIGGVYGVRVQLEYAIAAEMHDILQIRFTCAPPDVDKLVGATLKTILKLQLYPISEEMGASALR